MSAAERAGRIAALGATLAAGACAGPPWFLGSPLDGKASIPNGSAKPTLAQLHATAAREHTAGRPVLELEALLALDEAARLSAVERARLGLLLALRAAEFRARGRALPACRDLALLQRFSDGRFPALGEERAAAERAAGDAWLAIGARGQAQQAYAQATALGAAGMDFRMRAARDQPPAAGTSRGALEEAIAALPLRAIPPLAAAYLTEGGRERGTLARALAAARQERVEPLAARLAVALATPAAGGNAAAHTDAGAGDPPDAAAATAGAGAGDGGAPDGPPSSPGPIDVGAIDVAPAPPPAPRPVIPADLDHWVLGGVTLSGRLLPLVAAYPTLLDDAPRARRWVDLLLAEDPTSTEVLEVAAFAFGRAGRFGGTERMLMELAYYTPDRAAGLARGAAVWDKLGRTRESCAQWIRAARWRDDPEDPLWRNAVACARRDPGAGDWQAIRSYVLGRAAPDRRDAIAGSLDAP